MASRAANSAVFGLWAAGQDIDLLQSSWSGKADHPRRERRSREKAKRRGCSAFAEHDDWGSGMQWNADSELSLNRTAVAFAEHDEWGSGMLLERRQ